MHVFDPLGFSGWKTYLGVSKEIPARNLKKQSHAGGEKVFRLEDMQAGAPTIGGGSVL